MGLSSSQARLLSLTGRMHDIEYKAQKLEAQKLQMANESAHVYQEYENALNATKIQVKTIGADGSASFIDATYNSMRLLGYTLKFEDDYKPIISAATEANYLAAGNNRDYFIALESGRVTTTNRTVNGVTEIYTADQFKSMSSTGSYRLMADIDLSGTTWSSKSFSGTLDGNGHSITGLKTALFSTVRNGTVKNLSIDGDTTSNGILANYIYNGTTISDVSVSGSVNRTGENTGGLAGYVSGSGIKIENCSSSASVSATSNNAGGLIGNVGSRVTINNCSASGNVHGDKQNIGGLVGYLSSGSTITNSSASGNVTGTINENSNNGRTNCAGGFVGTSSGTIKNCEASGNVTAESAVIGGFAGHAAGSTSLIENCNAYGNVKGNASGNMAGSTNPNDRINAAGFCSAVNGGTIKNCNAYGQTSSGVSTNQTASFANSNMSGTDNIGKVINCYAQDRSKDFTYNANTATKLKELSQSTTPNNNVITVTPPSIKTTETVQDTTGAGKIFDDIQKYGGYILEGTANDPVGNNGDNSTWFTNMVNAGLLFIFKRDHEGNDYQVNVATDTSLQEVSNDIQLKKAEAKYEADMRKIDAKDKKYDTELAAMENERNAIKTEIDTLKNIAKDNVDRTFKLFS